MGGQTELRDGRGVAGAAATLRGRRIRLRDVASQTRDGAAGVRRGPDPHERVVSLVARVAGLRPGGPDRSVDVRIGAVALGRAVAGFASPMRRVLGVPGARRVRERALEDRGMARSAEPVPGVAGIGTGQPRGPVDLVAVAAPAPGPSVPRLGAGGGPLRVAERAGAGGPAGRFAEARVSSSGPRAKRVGGGPDVAGRASAEARVRRDLAVWRGGDRGRRSGVAGGAGGLLGSCEWAERERARGEENRDRPKEPTIARGARRSGLDPPGHGCGSREARAPAGPRGGGARGPPGSGPRMVPSPPRDGRHQGRASRRPSGRPSRRARRSRRLGTRRVRRGVGGGRMLRAERPRRL